MCDRYFGVNPLTVEPGVTADLPLNVDTPREVGADRVVSCVAAVALYGTPLIVVDFGTATRFDCVNRRGEFIGGAIAPGINTAAEALVSRAARLFRVELVRPKDAIGRNTITNIQSGMIYGWAGLVDGIVERMRREMEGDVKVVGTGGLVGQMREVVQCLQFVNPELKLEGLRMLWERANPVTPG
jgi:type III pantothenate kinase